MRKKQNGWINSIRDTEKEFVEKHIKEKERAGQ
jgi:hypothetical protein